MEEGFEHICKEWLPASPYERDESKPVLDSYPPSTTSGDSPVFLYVPIRGRGAH